jgi:hypothetical protein
MTTAAIIVQQLGGWGRVSAMTGAKSVLDHGNGVSFRFGNRGRSKPNFVKVLLDDASDTYTVEFGRTLRRNGCPDYDQLATFDGIYCDMLIQLFEDQTGLYLRL